MTDTEKDYLVANVKVDDLADVPRPTKRTVTTRMKVAFAISGLAVLTGIILLVCWLCGAFSAPVSTPSFIIKTYDSPTNMTALAHKKDDESAGHMQCTKESVGDNAEPMPNQILFCQEANGSHPCSGAAVMVTLYDIQKYMATPATIYTQGNFGNLGHDIHALIQGKYVGSFLSEAKPPKDFAQKVEHTSLSIGKHVAKHFACEAVTSAADGVPVCLIITLFMKFLGLWDLGQNTPTGQVGNVSGYYQHLGLGGNVNSIAIQSYDPYNNPTVLLYEYADCTGQSAAYASSNYTWTGTDYDIQKTLTYEDIPYPGKNANSLLAPWGVKITTGEGNSYDNVESLSCDSTNPDLIGKRCICHELPNTGTHNVAVSQIATDIPPAMSSAWADYRDCLATNTEVYCAAKDLCVEQNGFDTSACQTQDEINAYINPKWVPGNLCGN